MSSRFAEYVFAELRSRMRKGTKISAIAVPQHFRAHEVKLMAEASAPSTFELPAKHRESMRFIDAGCS